ncbi:MotA/TolQ/ExbB proton channel family protein [Rhodoferax sp.]|uniref:MotA/TolQ/ExbB proton channel family protein n=1 Tax=Rhodoferax sp. TaxID=50421 RepID=UPI0025EBC4C2|nr:MotA/TolQ/ExbB proton channel family protein [Rhodoferax sp.]MCM2342352.1 MotA/TolQ/ExbB proton channel family protein [Rhodoferax sp.]
MPPVFGLSHIWLNGDWITRGIMVMLLAMSLASWIVIVLKALDVWRYKQQAHKSEDFWHSHSLAEGLAVLGQGSGNLFHALATTGQEATDHHQAAQAQLHDRLDISDWVTRSLRNTIDDSTGKLQNGLAILASIGSTAPFVGLFGTVWGIYHALISIGSTGNAGIDAVAGPIGETLIMTALGLAVAIPAVLGYNALVRGNKFIIARMNRFAHDLHAYFVTGARVSPSAQASSLPASTAP